MFVILGESVAF